MSNMPDKRISALMFYKFVASVILYVSLKRVVEMLTAILLVCFSICFYAYGLFVGMLGFHHFSQFTEVELLTLKYRLDALHFAVNNCDASLNAFLTFIKLRNFHLTDCEGYHVRCDCITVNPRCIQFQVL